MVEHTKEIGAAVVVLCAGAPGGLDPRDAPMSNKWERIAALGEAMKRGMDLSLSVRFEGTLFAKRVESVLQQINSGALPSPQTQREWEILAKSLIDDITSVR